MELKLNVYEKRKIVKTFEADAYDLDFGTVEDITNAIGVDKLKTGSDDELMMVTLKALPNIMDVVKPLLKDVFDGLTDEDLRHCKIREIAQILVLIGVFTIQQVKFSFGGTEKN